MRRAHFLSLILALSALPALAATPTPTSIEFPCFKNLADGRVLVDGDDWDKKMKELGYDLAEGEYVPWKVLHFTEQTRRDDMWADGLCRMQLLPVAK